jgi:hypothetical protein
VLADAYDRYGRVVYSLFVRITRDQSAAEDLVQGLFLRLWNREELDESGVGTRVCCREGRGETMTHPEMNELYELYLLGTLEPELAREIETHVMPRTAAGIASAYHHADFSRLDRLKQVTSTRRPERENAAWGRRRLRSKEPTSVLCGK